MQEDPPFRIDPMRELALAVEKSVQRGQSRVRGAIKDTDTALRGRSLTPGEIAMIREMFGTMVGFTRARVFPHNFWWPYPNKRAMTPAGDIYFAGVDYRDDYSLSIVSLELRALFMHEATHLYQWYVLGQWVIVRGPFDRNYVYDLTPGKALRDYGLEQMGQIVQDYYTIRNGGAVRNKRYVASDYRDALPVRVR